MRANGISWTIVATGAAEAAIMQTAARNRRTTHPVPHFRMNLLVIGPDADRVLPLLHKGEVTVFGSLHAFDQWRKRGEMQAAAAGTIAGDVEAVLAEMGCTIDALEYELGLFFRALLSRAGVVSVKELMPEGISESTLYRRWRSSLPGTPKQFLMRVRLHQARRLVAVVGFPLKEAAWRAGFASAWHLRNALTITPGTHPPPAPRCVASRSGRETRDQSCAPSGR